MKVDNQVIGQLLAEILRLQRWAGGDSVSAARIFGLMHGFDSVLAEDRKPGISRATQDKVEDLLEDVEAGKQSVNSLAIEDRLRKDKVSESDAGLVMQLCRLQSRFSEAVKKIVDAPGSVFGHLSQWRPEERGWFGALHFVELVDSTEEVQKPMHAAFSPCVPRIGETVEPQAGSRMEVIAVEHVAVKTEGSDVLLIPHVILRPIKKRPRPPKSGKSTQ